MKTANVQQTLLIEGTSCPDDLQFPEELSGLLRAEPDVKTFVMAPPTRGLEAMEAQQVAARPDDIMELEMEGGIRLWMTVEEYGREFAPQEQRGPAAAESGLRIGSSLPVQTRERGIFKWVVKGLSLIGIDLAEGAAEKLAQRIDNKKGLNGLYNFLLAADQLTLIPTPRFPGKDEPLLVFIHGTMSSTEGSFGDLWRKQSGVRQRLASQYGDRVYAFEHKTFTESPVDNALALAEALPAGATVHLVSHSRGGMIGELLCRSMRADGDFPFDDKDLRLFDDPACVGKLQRLGKTLADKKLKIERFVRVACPARGTTLASKRLDRCISVLFSGVSLLDKSGWAGDITWFVSSVIKERTDPKTMPGIEAMTPDSATVKLLNRPGVMVDADLRVIAGDYDGDGMLGRLGGWASEEFFGSETDVVVNTPSMYGGAMRKAGGWYAYVRGPQVWHFSYFEQDKSAALLADGLLQESAIDAHFTALADAPHKDDEIARGVVIDLIKEGFGAKLKQRLPSEKGNKPIAVIVPGIMGTHLQADGQRIWLGPEEIIEGKFTKLGIDKPGVDTDGLIKMAYGAFAEFMGESHDAVVFPYDWRCSLREEGKRFADFMARVVDIAQVNGRPVRVVAHSMGGLLTRMAAVLTVEEGGNDWWTRLKALRGSRLVMAGTPNGGSWVVPFVLTGRDQIIKMLSLLDLFHNKNDLIKIVGRFDGFLEMLPADSVCFDPAAWASWRVDKENWPSPDPALLAKSAANRALMNRFDFQKEADFVCYLAGHDNETPQGAEVVKDNGKPQLRFLSSGRGDGRVLWATGIPAAKGMGVWYIPAKHGDLLNYPKSFPGIREVVDTGTTSLLAIEPPIVRSADGAVLPEAMVPYYPDADLLYRGMLGMSLGRQAPDARLAAAPSLKVAVCHGDLTAARHAVGVGHYAGDTINGAEAALDARLNGALQRRYRLGVYPGPEESSDVFLDETGQWGAIVVGLGQVGDLTAAMLSRSFARALLRFATMRPQDKKQAELQNTCCVSATLIGSGRGWGLGIKESIRALIDGARQANELLVAVDGVRIVELEFIELYEDRAVQALQAARELSTLGFAGPVEIVPTLRSGQGGRCRVASDTPDGWWQRIKIEETSDGALKFSTISGLARIEEQVQARQKILIDQLIDKSISSLSVSEQEMGAIYNLVTPNALKGQAASQGDLLLMLDPKAAGYPWEMMHAGGPKKPQPLALRAGLIRQLTVTDCRQHPSYSTELSALVIADPALPAGCPLPMLPGALSEGRAVVKAFSDKGVSVRQCLGAGSGEIVAALFNGEHRFVHLAGHGVYRCEPGDATGMVIDWRASQPVLLTSVEIEQMTRVPELVFINCCHLGVHPQTGETTNLTDRNRFAGDLAAAFVKMGVRAVIAAGWAVNDEAANLFAAAFYHEMFDGRSFGDAVRAARNAAAGCVGATNTWAAYQCYGDPGYRLRERELTTRGKVYLAPAEALCDIRALCVQTRDDQSGTPADSGKMLCELKTISAAIPHAWFNTNGALRDALGAACAAHGDFASAIAHYQAALRCNDGQCSLRAVEQLFNMQVRLIAKKPSASDSEHREKIAGIQAQIKSFKSMLDAIGESKERCSLMGSAFKRLVEPKMNLNEDPIADNTVQEMIDWYDKAMQLDPSDSNAALNWAMGLAALYVSGIPVDQEKLTAAVKQAGKIGREENERNPNFWSAIHVIDADFFLLLLEDLGDKKAARKTDKIIARYKAQFALGGNANAIDSVRSQFDFYLLFAKDKDVEKLLNKVKKGLQED